MKPCHSLFLSIAVLVILQLITEVTSHSYIPYPSGGKEGDYDPSIIRTRTPDHILTGRPIFQTTTSYLTTVPEGGQCRGRKTHPNNLQTSVLGTCRPLNECHKGIFYPTIDGPDCAHGLVCCFKKHIECGDDCEGTAPNGDLYLGKCTNCCGGNCPKPRRRRNLGIKLTVTGPQCGNPSYNNCPFCCATKKKCVIPCGERCRGQTSPTSRVLSGICRCKTGCKGKIVHAYRKGQRCENGCQCCISKPECVIPCGATCKGTTCPKGKPISGICKPVQTCAGKGIILNAEGPRCENGCKCCGPKKDPCPCPPTAHKH